MDIAIDRHGGANLAVALHAADGDGHIVNHAEAFAVVGKGVVEAAADVKGYSITQGVLGGEDRSPGGEPEGAHQFLGVRDFHLRLFLPRQSSGYQLVNVRGSVD